MATWRANRLEELPPYLFVEIDRRKREAIAAGRDVIDFGVGDPDQPTHDFIVRALAEAIRKPASHRYPLGIGTLAFRQAVANFFARRFGVALDPQTEIVALIGSKEGLGHLPMAVVNPGDTVLIPDPGYPVYTSGAVFAGGRCHYMALREENGWLPVFKDIPAQIRRDGKLMFLNYPNNPTAACAPLEFFEKAVAFAHEHHILIASDAAYSEVYFDANHPPPSILQVPGAKDVAIEFHSLSKTFNMTGWRVGFAVGNAEALAALAKVKSNIDSGVFGAVQGAAIPALQNALHPAVVAQTGPGGMYARRRDVLVEGLRRAGWSVASPQATFYVWARCPSGENSMAVAQRILAETDVVVVPGIGFGRCGEGYIRFALTVEEPRTRQAVERISRLTW